MRPPPRCRQRGPGGNRRGRPAKLSSVSAALIAAPACRTSPSMMPLPLPVASDEPACREASEVSAVAEAVTASGALVPGGVSVLVLMTRRPHFGPAYQPHDDRCIVVSSRAPPRSPAARQAKAGAAMLNASTPRRTATSPRPGARVRTMHHGYRDAPRSAHHATIPGNRHGRPMTLAGVPPTPSTRRAPGCPSVARSRTPQAKAWPTRRSRRATASSQTRRRHRSDSIGQRRSRPPRSPCQPRPRRRRTDEPWDASRGRCLMGTSPPAPGEAGTRQIAADLNRAPSPITWPEPPNDRPDLSSPKNARARAVYHGGQAAEAEFTAMAGSSVVLT